MQISLTATGGLERRLEVAVPADRVDSEVNSRLKALSRTARLKGFRPGKAPLTVIRKQFGGQVHAEVVGDLMRSTLAEAIDQEKLKPAAGPRIEPLAVEPGGELRYAATFEVLPEVQLKSLEGVTIERPVASVSDAEVEAMIESMRRQRPTFTEVSRPAHTTDRVTIDFAGRVGGEPFQGGEGTDAAIVLGARQIMPEIEQVLAGAAAGEERQVLVTFPAEHANKALAGQTAEFTIKVKRVEEQGLPALDEEFFNAFGVKEGGLEQLKAEVRQGMARELEERVRGRLRSQVLDALYREHPLEVPRSLVDDQIREMQLDAARRIGARDASQIPPREPFEEPARRRVTLGLLLGELIRSEDLKLDRAKVQERLTEVASSYPNPDEIRRAYLQSVDAMRQIESAVLEEQAVDRLLERVRIEDRPSSFKELTGFGGENP